MYANVKFSTFLILNSRCVRITINLLTQHYFLFSELNYCENNPELCRNGAKCVSLTKEDGNYRCMCREGTYGRNCEFSEYTTTTTTTTSKTFVDNATTVSVEETTTVVNGVTNSAENETN